MRWPNSDYSNYLLFITPLYIYINRTISSLKKEILSKSPTIGKKELKKQVFATLSQHYEDSLDEENEGKESNMSMESKDAIKQESADQYSEANMNKIVIVIFIHIGF